MRRCANRRKKPGLPLIFQRELAPLAREAGLKFEIVPWENRLDAESHALELLEEQEIDFVVLGRFMKILSPNFV